MIELPWPDKSLSPNARGHWAKSASAKQSAKRDAKMAALAAGYRNLNFEALHLRITFHPPDRRKRDLDNMLSSLKSALDGVRDAVGVDDSNWELTIRRGEKVEGGVVVVEIGPPSDQKFVPYRGMK